MTIVTESLGISGSDAILYEDTSGGNMVMAITHPDYLSNHRFRVIPFDNVGTGLFTAAPAGTTTGLQQEADNLAVLTAACYANDSSLAFIAANQVLSDNTGTQPYPFSFGGGSASVGTAAGASEPRWLEAVLVAKGVDGSRWQLRLPGLAVNQLTTFGRLLYTSWAAAIQALALYLTGGANGPTHAAKTNVVTHSGAKLALPVYIIGGKNKRIARHFRVA